MLYCSTEHFHACCNYLVPRSLFLCCEINPFRIKVAFAQQTSFSYAAAIERATILADLTCSAPSPIGAAIEYIASPTNARAGILAMLRSNNTKRVQHKPNIPNERAQISNNLNQITTSSHYQSQIIDETMHMEYTVLLTINAQK